MERAIHGHRRRRWPVCADNYEGRRPFILVLVDLGDAPVLTKPAQMSAQNAGIFVDKVETCLPYLFAATTEDTDEAGERGYVKLPHGAAMSWWEDGRVVWNDTVDPKITHVATF